MLMVQTWRCEQKDQRLEREGDINGKTQQERNRDKEQEDNRGDEGRTGRREDGKKGGREEGRKESVLHCYDVINILEAQVSPNCSCETLDCYASQACSYVNSHSLRLSGICTGVSVVCLVFVCWAQLLCTIP